MPPSLWPRLLASLIVCTGGFRSLAAQDMAQNGSRVDQAFRWSGMIPTGKRLVVRNVNGPISVSRGTSPRVEVVAEKRWERGNAEVVRIVQQTVNQEVVICALWNDDATCDLQGMQGNRTSWRERTGDVRVHFTVQVPEGVRLELTTVNGGISLTLPSSFEGHVDLATMHGRVITDFPLTITGGISAQQLRGTIGTGTSARPLVVLRASTVNGGIRLRKAG